ncbi:hypothetical protein QEG26_004402 [Stenotrophomonas maltophilia]|nr:hypothetical protein [Stenotrophomonas maltophilia]
MAAEVGPLISKRDATIACVIALLFGTILTALALISSDIPLKAFDAGNAADWLAAIFGGVAAGGTWAIGVGANRYAAQAQAREERQIELADREASRHRAAQIRLMKVWARLARQPFDSLVQLVEELGGDDPPDRAAATGAVAGNRDLLANIRWDDAAWMLLSEEGIEAKIRLEVAVRAYNFICNSYVDDYDIEAPDASDLLDPTEGGFHLVYHAASEIADMADAVSREVASAVHPRKSKFPEMPFT